MRYLPVVHAIYAVHTRCMRHMLYMHGTCAVHAVPTAPFFPPLIPLPAAHSSHTCTALTVLPPLTLHRVAFLSRGGEDGPSRRAQMHRIWIRIRIWIHGALQQQGRGAGRLNRVPPGCEGFRPGRQGKQPQLPQAAVHVFWRGGGVPLQLTAVPAQGFFISKAFARQADESAAVLPAEQPPPKPANVSAGKCGRKCDSGVRMTHTYAASPIHTITMSYPRSGGATCLSHY